MQVLTGIPQFVLFIVGNSYLFRFFVKMIISG